MLFIIEGPDGSGKTTLIEQLRENSGSNYFIILKSSGPPKNSRELRAYLNLLEMPLTVPVLCDRHPIISDPIYSQLVGRKTSVEGNPNEHLDRATAIIYCRPPIQHIAHNIETSEQMEGVNGRLQTLVRAYDHRMLQLEQTLQIPVIQYNYLSNSIDFIKALIWK